MDADLSASLLVLGRILLGGLFVAGGVKHCFVGSVLVVIMKARGVPQPGIVLAIGSAFQLVAGVLLMLGIQVTLAALGLVVFTILATIMFLDFWNKAGPQRDAETNAALTNIGVIGGLLVAAAVPA